MSKIKYDKITLSWWFSTKKFGNVLKCVINSRNMEENPTSKKSKWNLRPKLNSWRCFAKLILLVEVEVLGVYHLLRLVTWGVKISWLEECSNSPPHIIIQASPLARWFIYYISRRDRRRHILLEFDLTWRGTMLQGKFDISLVKAKSKTSKKVGFLLHWVLPNVTIDCL